MSKLLNHKPLILGSSIAGIAISRQLSLEKIDHILIGEPKTVSRPILGESVEMYGVVILKKLFPELSDYFYPKLGINYYLSHSHCHFDFIRCFKIPDIIELMKETGYTHKMCDSYSLIHLDRAEFDRAAFEQVIKSKHCYYINQKIKGCEYDKKERVIKNVWLEDGSVLIPSFVFDASSTARLLPKWLKLESTWLSGPLKVVYTHYKMSDTQDLAQLSQELPWIYNTEILRHYKEISGFNGSSWCIPIGRHVSVGTSIIGETYKSDEEVLDTTLEAYRKKQVNYRSIYTQETTVKSISGRLYYYEELFGRNWILTSGAASLTWYTSQAGVESAMFIANIADRILKYPTDYGNYYKEFILQQVKMHHIHNWLHYHEKSAILEKDVYAYMINSIRCIQGRFLLGNLCLDHSIMKKIKWLQDIKKYQSELTELELNSIIDSVKRMETCAEYVTMA